MAGNRDWSHEEFFAQRPAATANASSGAAVRGVPFADVERLPLSASVRTALDDARRWAVEQRFRGQFGTGMMLLAMARHGEEGNASGPHDAGVFAELLRQHGGDAFEQATERYLDDNRLRSSDPAQPPNWVSRNLWRCLEDAKALPNDDGVLASRHVIVGLLTQARTGSPLTGWALLDAAGIDRGLLLQDFLRHLAADAPESERAAWAQLAEALATRGPLIPSFHADTPTGRAADDCLDLGATVDAMANLIASTHLADTLAIGVFGDWGSGKSFFMKRLRTRIAEIAAAAQNAEAPAKGAPARSYWPNIAQIEFNAWHYVDANLWASLMSHLLDALRRWQPVEAPAAPKSPLAAAIEQLEIAAAARAAAKAREASAEQAKADAEAKRKAAEQQLGDAAKALGDALRANVWDHVEKQLGPQLQPARKALEDLGLVAKDAQMTSEGLLAHARDVAATSGRLGATVQQLLRDEQGTRSLGKLLLLVAIAIAVVGALALFVDRLRDLTTLVATALAGVAATATRLVTLVRGAATRVEHAIAPVLAARTAIESALQRAEQEKAARVAAAESDVAVAQAALDAATREVAARDQALQLATQAIADVLGGRAVRTFLEQRLAAGDYQKQLGLIATIRRDLEQLSDLVGGHNLDHLGLPEREAMLRATLQKSRPDLTAEQVAELLRPIGLNRIVLYIDDLDRCPSSHVVDVLQAIHLLISFPIFVVVVGVDSRWMAHALAHEYPALLARDAERPASDANAADGRAPVTPADYLEKIFQIPFWVPPLEPDATRKLLTRLAGGADGAQPYGAADGEGEAGAQAAGDGGDPGAIPGGGAGGGAGRPAKPTAPRGITKAPAAAVPGAPPASPDNEPPAAPPPPPLRPDLLRIGSGEERSMHSLAALIGRSPRATKRFVNTYRLLKVALVGKEPAKFRRDSEQAGDLHAPMFLLAIVTGVPTLATAFTYGLAAEPDASAVDVLAALARDARHDPRHGDAGRRILEFERSDQAAAWRDLTGTALLPWLTRVAQFSFEDLPSPWSGSPAQSGAEGSEPPPA